MMPLTDHDRNLRQFYTSKFGLCDIIIPAGNEPSGMPASTFERDYNTLCSGKLQAQTDLGNGSQENHNSILVEFLPEE